MNTGAQSGPPTLAEWLDHIGRVHPQTIELGLVRVAAVRDAMGLAPRCPLITVGGTNGKGSVCAMLESVLAEAGYRVGCYTSPHLLRYNERVRIDRIEAADEDLAQALDAVETARSDVALTYFEFSTLAAMWLFRKANVDVAVLEVGLGGRLDAVNVFDADCAVVTSIALDHLEYLGDTREAIGFEKAGIFRAGKPAICADADPPVTLVEQARVTGSELLLIDRDFGCRVEPGQWQYWGPGGERHGLPHPALRGDYQVVNASACLAALDCLRGCLPVSAGHVRSGLLAAVNPGRFQVRPGLPVVIFDVAHNPAAAAALARNLARMPRTARTLAVFAMLKDKNIAAVAAELRTHIDEWHIAPIDDPRGADAACVRDELARAGISGCVHDHTSLVHAFAQACDSAAQNDRIVVFGSFHTVAAAMAGAGAQ